MENPPIFKFGKPSISIGAISHGYVSHSQRVNQNFVAELSPFFSFIPIFPELSKRFSEGRSKKKNVFCLNNSQLLANPFKNYTRVIEVKSFKFQKLLVNSLLPSDNLT